MRAISARWCKPQGPDARKPQKHAARTVLSAEIGAIEIAGAVVSAWGMAASVRPAPIVVWVGRVGRHRADPTIWVREVAIRTARAGVHSLIR